MAKSLPRISDAEWTVMRVFWEFGEHSVGKAIERLVGQTDWKPRTIQTFLVEVWKKMEDEDFFTRRRLRKLSVNMRQAARF